MTIGTTISQIVAEGNGVTTSFPYTFLIPAASDVTVIYTSPSGVATTLLPSQYNISGIGVATGGAVTYPLSGSPIATGSYLLIQRTLPVIQSVSVSNQGPTFSAIEGGLDYLTMLIQDELTTIDLALTGNPTDPAGLTYNAPPVAQRGGQVMGWDSSGNVIAAQPTGTLVSSVMQPVVEASTLAGAAAAMQVVPTDSASIAMNVANEPLGQSGGLTVYSAEYLQGTTQYAYSPSAPNQEYLMSLNLISDMGQGADVASSSDKVTLYAAVSASANSGNVWAANFNMLISPGALPQGGGQTIELDANNNSGTNYGDTAGYISSPAVFGAQISGVSTNRMTAALWITGTGPAGGAMWNRGILFQSNGSGPVSQVCIQDFSGAQKSIEINGQHWYGVDLWGSEGADYSSASIRLPQQGSIKYANAGTLGAYTHDIQMIDTDGTNQILIGDSTYSPNIGFQGATATVTFATALLNVFGTTAALAATNTIIYSANVTLGTASSTVGFYGATPAAKPTITGSRGGNAALASLLTQLATLGLVTDSTS